MYRFCRLLWGGKKMLCRLMALVATRSGGGVRRTFFLSFCTIDWHVRS